QEASFALVSIHVDPFDAALRIAYVRHFDDHTGGVWVPGVQFAQCCFYQFRSRIRPLALRYFTGPGINHECRVFRLADVMAAMFPARQRGPNGFGVRLSEDVRQSFVVEFVEPSLMAYRIPALDAVKILG